MLVLIIPTTMAMLEAGERLGFWGSIHLPVSLHLHLQDSYSEHGDSKDGDFRVMGAAMLVFSIVSTVVTVAMLYLKPQPPQRPAPGTLNLLHMVFHPGCSDA